MGKIIYSHDISRNIIPIHEDDIIFTIVSMIHVSNRPMFDLPRTVYTPKERFEQTMKQLQKLHEIKSENTKIIVQELSLCFTTKSEEIIEMSKYCDLLILYNDSRLVNYYSHVQECNKGLSEILVYCYLYIELLRHNKFKKFIKMTGRYQFKNNFDYSLILNNTNLLRKWNNESNITSFYMLDYKYLEKYFNEIYPNFKKNLDWGIEIILTRFIDKYVDKKEYDEDVKLNIIAIASNGEYFEY